MSLYSLNAKIKMLFFAWLTPVVKTNITRVLHQQYLSPPTTKMYMPHASIFVTFYDFYDPITEKHFKSVSGKIQRCFQEYVICDIRKNGREQKQTPRRATVCNGEKSITYFSVESVLTQVATKIIRGPLKFLLTF